MKNCVVVVVVVVGMLLADICSGSGVISQVLGLSFKQISTYGCPLFTKTNNRK